LGIIEWVNKENKQSRLQKYQLTQLGWNLVKEIEQNNE